MALLPNLKEEDVAAETVVEVIKVLDERYPGLAGYLVGDQGVLRIESHRKISNAAQ